MIVPLPKPASDVEAEIFEFVKESDPSTAYLQGASDYVGKLFIPSRKNLERVARRADELRLRAENNAQLKVIDSFAAGYALQEPQLYPDGVLTAFFGFRVKEYKNKGFHQVYRIIKREGAHLGREKIYAQALRRLCDYPESPQEVEAKGLKLLERELPRFKRITERLAKKYGVAAKADDVS